MGNLFGRKAGLKRLATIRALDGAFYAFRSALGALGHLFGLEQPPWALLMSIVTEF